MATTTTNYGFDVPTSSDLVKNGATAISTLGQDIDTFLFRPFTKNIVINGAFDIWQRGTSGAIPAASPYRYVDAWQTIRGSAATGGTVSRQVSGQTFTQYCARIQRDSGNTSTQTLNLLTSFESSSVIPLQSQTITVSYYARAGANYSAASNALAFSVITGTGTDGNLTAGFTSQTTAASATATLTTSWQRFTTTLTLGSTISQLGIQFAQTPTGTASTNDYFEITGVQLEVGSQASPFTRAGGTIQGELAACQRYYARIGFPYVTNNAPGIAVGRSYSTTGGDAIIPLSVPLRTVATSVDYSGLQFNDQNNTTYSLSAVSLNSNQQPNIGMITMTSTGMTANRMGWLIGSAGANTGYIGFSAEL